MNSSYSSRRHKLYYEAIYSSEAASFEDKVCVALGEWPKGTKFLAAVSGGCDSTAMLAALAEIRRKKGWGLSCLHVEHGIRPVEESRGDAAAVQELCKCLRVPCRVIHISPGAVAKMARTRRIGIEAAARLFRHSAWNREAAKIGAMRVLVAHTKDDLLETALMRVLRGSGPAGLAAMPRVSGLVLRPLLELRRSQALAYIAKRGIPFRNDPTNADLAFLRNRIRNRLVPFLNELFPGWRTSLANLGETQRFAADFLSAEAERRIPWEAASGAESGTRRSCRVSRETFFSQPEILREEGIFLAADKIGGGKPRRVSVRRFTRDGCRVLDLGGMRIEAAEDWVTVCPLTGAYEEEGFSLLIKKPGIYKLKGYPLTLRCLAGGEAFRGTAGSFMAGLPLVLRPSWTRDRIESAKGVRRRKDIFKEDRCLGRAVSITAEDSCGIASFIKISRNEASVIAERERSDSEYNGKLFFFVIV